MNKTISTIRIAILFILGFSATILLFGEEQDESITYFLLHTIMDKSLAFALFFYFGRLYKRWSKVDPWIMAYDKMCEEVMEAPNPLCDKNKRKEN